jgi:hypothetical protein
MHGLVFVQGDAELLEVVDALSPACRFAGGLDGGEQQPDQERDDADYHEELDERERTTSSFREA